MSVYRVTDLIGTSTQSWEDAASAAIKAASGTLRDIRVAEVVAQDIMSPRTAGSLIGRSFASRSSTKPRSRRPSPPHPPLSPRRNRRLSDRLDRGFESAQPGVVVRPYQSLAPVIVQLPGRWELPDMSMSWRVLPPTKTHSHCSMLKAPTA